MAPKFLNTVRPPQLYFADGCLSHRTAVAAACLSQFLRFLVNPGSPDYQQYAHIDGPNHLLAKPILIGKGQTGEEDMEDEEEEARDMLRDGQLQAARAQVDLVEAEERAELRKKALWDALDQQDHEEREEDEEHVMLGGGGRLNRLQDDEGEDDDDVILQAKDPLQEGEEEERVLLRGGQLNRLQQEEDNEEEDEETKNDEDQDAPAYYNDDDDKEENKVNHLQKAAVAAAQQQLKIANDQEDDKQYIDDDNTHEQPDNHDSKPQQAKPFQDTEHHHVDVKEINDDVYNDYDDSKVHKFNLVNPKLGIPTPSMMLETSSESSMVTGYAIILGTMTVVLVFMYRFIRKRRILIKYRYAR